MKIFDVAVVGAGPSGATAACHLAEAGVRVIILEKMAWPRDKTCGGGLVARALKELPHGMDPPALQHCHKAQINLNDIKLSFTATREAPIVTMIMRSDFDQALIKAAIDKGALFQGACSVIDLQQGTTSVKLGTSAGPVHARMIIAADGVRSPLARHAGFQDGRILASALEWEIPATKELMQRFADVARFDFGIMEDGYAWIFPKQDHLSVGLVSMRNGARDLPARLEGYLGERGIPFKQALSRNGHLIPVAPRRGKLCKGRILLTGDAAGLTDPVTAEGITLAMQSGRHAAQAVICAGLDPERAAREYQLRLQQDLLPEIHCGRRLATLLYRMPRCRKWLFTRHGQKLAERMADLVMGEASYRELVRSSSSWLRMLGLRTNC